MPIEIERKFLVVGDAWRAAVTRSETFDQGYLVGTPARASVRVRVSAYEARLNIKAAVIGAARAEYDYPLPAEDARELLENLCVGRVTKIRHYMPCGKHLWEIDEFTGANAGLVVAEIELSRPDEPFEKPAWLGREVTEDARYYNHALALRPYRDWPDDQR